MHELPNDIEKFNKMPKILELFGEYPVDYRKCKC